MSWSMLRAVIASDEQDSAVYRVMIALADFTHEDTVRVESGHLIGECFPGQEKLAKKSRMSEVHLRRMIRRMESKGLVETWRTDMSHYRLVLRGMGGFKTAVSAKLREGSEISRNGSEKQENAEQPNIVFGSEPKRAVNSTQKGGNPDKQPSIQISHNRTFETTQPNIQHHTTEHLGTRNKEEPVLTKKQPERVEPKNIYIESAYKFHPRLQNPQKTELAVRDVFKYLKATKGMTELEAAGYLCMRTQRYLEYTDHWPPDQKKYIVSSFNWYQNHCFEEDHRVWDRRDEYTRISHRMNNFFLSGERALLGAEYDDPPEDPPQHVLTVNEPGIGPMKYIFGEEEPDFEKFPGNKVRDDVERDRKVSKIVKAVEKSA